MAEDSRSQSDTDDLPTALEAFHSEREARLGEDAFAVSRAAALLSLVRPRKVEASEYRLATAEARERLGVEPIEPSDLGREELVVEFEGFGEGGERAAGLLREGRRFGRRVTDEPTAADQGGIEPSSWVVRLLRAESESERIVVDRAQRDAAQELFVQRATTERQARRGNPAAKLIAASLLDEDRLVQVAAAAAALRVDAKNPLAEAILQESSRGQSDEIAELSRAVLLGDRESETRVVEIEYPAGAPDSAADSTLIHGTWARNGHWWQPGEQLHVYLRQGQNLFPHLYMGPDPFMWSGYFGFRAWPKTTKDWNRQQAAASLAWWAHRKLTNRPDLIGHSYGGSLSMMVTQAEKKVRGMVLLSPAVHQTCLPDPANYEQLLHVTMALDLVLLADLSTPGLMQALPNITQYPVRRKGLTGHGATHDPRVWRDSGLTDYVRDVWLPSLSSRS